MKSCYFIGNCHLIFSVFDLTKVDKIIVVSYTVCNDKRKTREQQYRTRVTFGDEGRVARSQD